MRGRRSRTVGALLGERAVEDDGDDVGVVPQVGQLVGRVAVVGVDHGEPGLERGEHRLEVLRGRCRGTGRPCPARRRPGRGGGRRRRRRAGRTAATSTSSGVPLGRRVGQPVGDRLPHLGVVPATAVTRRILGCSAARGVGQRGGPCSRRSLAARAASTSLTAPHIDSIHQVAPARPRPPASAGCPRPRSRCRSRGRRSTRGWR